jgi:hypothetical protein
MNQVKTGTNRSDDLKLQDNKQGSCVDLRSEHKKNMIFKFVTATENLYEME